MVAYYEIIRVMAQPAQQGKHTFVGSKLDIWKMTNIAYIVKSFFIENYQF